MYYSSKVYSKHSWSASRNRIADKDMLITEIFDSLHCNVKDNKGEKLEYFNDFMKMAMQFDEELYSDNQDSDWYYDNIRKNLKKLNEFTLIFLLNCLTSIRTEGYVLSAHQTNRDL